MAIKFRRSILTDALRCCHRLQYPERSGGNCAAHVFFRLWYLLLAWWQVRLRFFCKRRVNRESFLLEIDEKFNLLVYLPNVFEFLFCFLFMADGGRCAVTYNCRICLICFINRVCFCILVHSALNIVQIRVIQIIV